MAAQLETVAVEHLPFGKYTLLRRLARGGMAELYLARPSEGTVMQRMVVLKVIASRYATDESFSKMFQDEVRIAATLSHPNIGQVVDVGQVGRRQYLAMEYLHGKDLRAIVRQLRRQGRRGVPPHIAAHIATRTCAALQHAHDARTIDGEPLSIIHRDVSPSNVMITFDGQIKLLDFGIAKAANRVSLTQPGTIKGKVRYLSPEQLLGKAIDQRTDIFTLGVTLWEGTVGCHLFEGKQDFQVYDAISSGKIRPPSSLLPNYPPELERIVLKALSFEPDERYASAREMQEDLERYAMAQRLMLSDLATADFLRHLFADEVAAWEESQAAGQSMLDYLLATASEDDQELGSMREAEEQRHTLPDEEPAPAPPASAAGAIETPRAAPMATSPAPQQGGERKTILFGELGPIAPPVPAVAPPAGVASPSGPMTIGGRPPSGVTPALEREKKSTDPRSLPAQQQALRVSDGLAVELHPDGQVSDLTRPPPEGYEAAIERSSDDSRRPTMVGNLEAKGPESQRRTLMGEAAFGAGDLEPADSPKMTIMDLGGPPHAQAPPEALVQPTGPVQPLAPDASVGRKLTTIDSGAVPIGAMAPPAPGAPSTQQSPPVLVPPTQAPDPSKTTGKPATAAAPNARVVASGPSEVVVVEPGLESARTAYAAPVVAADRAALAAGGGRAVGDDEAEPTPLRKKKQTGDWSTHGRDRRPGTHPFFKGDDGLVDADGLDNPYARASRRKGSSRLPIIILLVLVVVLGGGGAAAWYFLRGGGAGEGAAKEASYKLTSRPSGATAFSAADGRELGKTPLALTTAQVGAGKVELHLDGYEVVTVTLTRDRHIVLQPKGSASKPVQHKVEEKSAPVPAKPKPPAKRAPERSKARKRAPAAPASRRPAKKGADLKDPFGG